MNDRRTSDRRTTTHDELVHHVIGVCKSRMEAMESAINNLKELSSHHNEQIFSITSSMQSISNDINATSTSTENNAVNIEAMQVDIKKISEKQDANKETLDFIATWIQNVKGFNSTATLGGDFVKWGVKWSVLLSVFGGVGIVIYNWFNNHWHIFIDKLK